MIQLVYVSSAIHPFSNAELVALLTKARTKNAALQVTGMLLYKDGNFIQAIEGEEATVRQLFARISADPRHRGTEVVIDEEIPERTFADWSMGFRNLADAETQALPGFTRVMNHAMQFENLKNDTTGCMDLLQFFAQTR